MQGNDDRIGKKYQAKLYGKINVIPLLPLLGVNHCQPIFHMFKILVYLYTTDECINQFPIGYMINPTLHVNMVFREQVENLKSYIS